MQFLGRGASQACLLQLTVGTLFEIIVSFLQIQLTVETDDGLYRLLRTSNKVKHSVRHVNVISERTTGKNNEFGLLSGEKKFSLPLLYP